MRTLSKATILLFAFSISLIILFGCESKKKNDAEVNIFASELILRDISISPDGRWLAFTTFSVNNSPESTIVNLVDLKDNSHLTVFSQRELIIGPIGWSLDSTSIFVGESEGYGDDKKNYIRRVSIDTKKEEIIDTPCQGTLYGPAPSPDDRIIFLELLSRKEVVNDYEYNYSNLWYMDKDREAKVIADGIIGLDYKLYGDNIYFVKGKKEDGNVIWNLFSMNIQEDEEQKLADKIAAVMFIDMDSSFIYLKAKGDSYEIYKISRNGLDVSSLGFMNKGVYSPAISQDGNKIAFLRNNQVWVIDLRTLEERQLTHTDERKQKVIWTKDGRYVIYSTIKSMFKVEIEEN